MPEQTTERTIEIFSDGACSGNPGPGGFGTILRCGEHLRELCGYSPCTTNNRMEMLGAIAGLEALKFPCKVKLTTDSQYLLNGITKWIHAWKKKNWKNSQNKEVLNKDLWLRLDKLSQSHIIEWHWVRGHTGHLENERCDELARLAIVEKGPRIEEI